MESLQSFLQLAADLEGRLNANEDNAEITTIFENYLDAGIDQLEISSQMQIARNDRDIQTITIIENLLKYKKQPLGFTDKVLENAMSILSDSPPINSSEDSEFFLDSCHIQSLIRCSKHLCTLQGLSGEAHEAAYRRSVLGLVDPVKVFESYLQLVKAGQLRNALLIHEYFPVHCRFETIKEAYNAYESIPQDVIGNDLKQWLVTDLVPSLFTSYDDTYTDNDTGNQSEVLELGKLPVILKICVNLVDWAREFEDVDQNPIQALVVINCAAQILTQALGLTSVLPSWEKSSTHITESQSIKPNFTYLTMKEIYSVPKVSMTSIDSIVQSVFSTQLSLQLQREIWFLWSFKLRFIEIERSGIQSIVYKRLWLVPNDAIELELTDNIAPVLRQCGLSIDHVLEGWIREALQTRVVTCKSGVDSSMFDGNNSTEGDLNKLVLVAKLIMNPHSKAHAVLSLLQVPVVTSLDSGSDDDDSDDSNIDLGERKREQQRVLVEAHKHCIDALCEAAHALCSVVDSKTNDLLVESLRLQRIKTLAFQYGVDTFDPRDYKQVRAVAGLIASHVESPSSIPDAIEIVQAWSAGGFDISGFLTRALVHRASYQPVGPSEERGHIRKRLLASALKLVPSMKLKVVVESTINCLTQILEDICDDNDNADTDDDAENENQPYFGELSTSEDQERYSVCCESALYILSWYLDEKKGLPESPLYSFNSHSNTVGSMLASTDNHDSGDASDTLISNSSFPLSLSGDTSTLFSCVHYGTLVMLKRLRHTQREFGLYLPPTAVNDTEVCKEVVGRIAEQHVEELLELIPKACDVVQAAAIVESDVLVTLRHRRICAALNVSLVYFSHRTVKCLFGNNQKEIAMQLANSFGIEKDATSGPKNRAIANDDDARLLIDTAVTLSAMAARQVFSSVQSSRVGSRSNGNAVDSAQWLTKSFDLSRSLLQSTALCCSPILLSQVVDLLQGADIALSVFSRIEGKFSQSNSSCYATHSESNFEILEHNFARDGILMSSSKVLGPLMKFCMKEMQRRKSPISNGSRASAVIASRVTAKGKSSATADRPSATPMFTMPFATDVEELVAVLQKSENHLLATRVLLGSWHISSSKSESIRQSTMTLCRKILTYRGIDTGLAVASLGMLPFEQMVKEVKASVPSIQSDFSRLRTVALVGEEVARMWDQETLLIVFQSLQMNARWWHILSSHGIKIDARAFQSADSNLREAYMKGVVPDLLLHTNLNLDLAYEYCQQFNLEPEVATLCYIESIMLLPPYVSSSWKTSLQLASVGISEKLLVSRLRKVLEKIHPLDYDKIQYSCTWLANAIGDDQDRESVSTNGKGKPSHTSISDTAAQVEFKNYLMYSETVTFLSAHHFPTDLLCSISHIKSYYSNVPESFKTRLPFWSLLEEPWAIIEPLMAADPDAATKLSPLCTILHIDKDEFYSRAIMSSYTHAYEASGSKSFVTENYNSSVTIGVDQKVVEASKLALNSVRDSIGLIAGCFRQIELWRWVFEKELHTNPSIAVVALNEAVALLEVRSQELKISTAEDKDDELLEVNCILSELQLERVKISCRLCLQYLETKFSTTDSHLFDAKKTLSLISHPTAMLQKIFEDAVECCWSLQLKSVRMYASVYTVRDLISQPLAPSVATLIDSVGDKVVEICDICKVLTDNTIRPYLISVDSENVFTAKKPSTLNTDTDTTSGKDMKKSKVNDQVNAATELDLECDIRSTIVTKLLADIDPLVESSSGPGSKSATASGMQHNASVMTSFETATSIKNKKVNGAFSASLWGRSDDSTLSLTESELRRRDDLYLAFSLAVVVGSCRNIDNKVNYTQRLDAVMKGNNPRTMRRLTARSKLRAAQALLLLRTLPIQSSSSQSTSLLQAVGLSLRDLQKRHIYLYCFAELQETRLLCSEESLSDALGIKFCTTDTGYSKVQVTVSNPKPLVRTWVHDEGALTEAMELSRDVLLTAQITDASIWKTVLSTLLHHGHGRPLLQTLLNLINANLLQSILHDESELRNQLTAYVSRFVEEAAEKLGQIWDVVRLKVKSSMAESATIQTKHATASVSYGKVSDSDCSVSISKQELQRLLAAAEGNSNGGDKTGEKDKNDKEKSAGPTSADINHALSGPGGLSKARRTLLVERCQASVLGWEEPPEELILNLSQAASLWTYFSDGTVYTASKEYQSRIGVACQKILSLLCQTFNLSSSDSSEAGQSRRLTVDEALRQSGLKCMLALIRSSCSSLSDLRKLLHTESAVTSGSVKMIVNFLESLLLTIVKQISTSVTSTLSTSDFADQCLWGLFNVCAASLPKILTLQLLSSVFLRLQEQQGSNAAVDVLTRLLRLATGRWMDSEDCRLASTAVFSWCLQLPNQPVVGGDNANNEGGGCAEEGDCEDKLSLVQAAIFGLQKKDRCHLRLAVDGILDKDMVGQVHKLFSHDV